MKARTITFTLLLAISNFSCSYDRNYDNYDLSKKLTKQFSSRHFRYYLEWDDKVDTIFQEKYFEWLLKQLQVDLSDTISYYKLKDKQIIENLTGFEANAFANPDSNAIFTIWPSDNHECVHLVLCRNVGCPPALFGEGIAVAHQAYTVDDEFIPSWNGEDFHVLSKTYYEDKTLPNLDSLLGIYSYWNIDMNITYPVAGSFVRYLVDNYGINTFKELISLTNYTDSASIMRLNFKEYYKIEIDSVWNDWIGFIRDYDI